MGLAYRIYANNGQGGPVDYETPIGVTSGLSFTCRPLELSSDSTFVVRTYDQDLDIEESNTDARVRILIDQSGQDVSGQPSPPTALYVRPVAGGSCRATWAYMPTASSRPTGFFVYLTQGMAPSYTTPVATVAYSPDTLGYSCILSNLSDGVVYTVAVRAYNQSATELNTSVVAQVTGVSTPPNPVDSLQVVATA